MDIAAWLPWTDLGAVSLTQAHVARRLPEDLRAPGLESIPQRPDGPEQAFLDDLIRDLDTHEASPWLRLREPGARAVVTGQQPGCAGGTLLVLYKVATAVALARRLTSTLDKPVVPVFWNAADDVDFDEIARVAWPQRDAGVAFLELPRAHRRSQAFVGALPATGDFDAAQAAHDSLDADARARLSALLPRRAADHGDWVGRFLGAVFPELAVLDARNPALRRHAQPLYERYLQAKENVAAQLAASGQKLEALGYKRTLSDASARMALFLVRDEQRHKVDDDVQPLRRALESDPEGVGSNVVLRPLVQDLLLPVVASVIGPSELGYLLELRPIRPLLDVPEPALVPRLTMTLLEAEGWREARTLGLEPDDILSDSEAAWRELATQRDGGTLRRLRESFDRLDRDLDTLGGDDTYAARLTRTRRRARTLHDELAGAIGDAALQTLWAEKPALAALRSQAWPRGRAQERLFAGLWLVSRWGRHSGARLVDVATDHLAVLERRSIEHAVVVD